MKLSTWPRLLLAELRTLKRAHAEKQGAPRDRVAASADGRLRGKRIAILATDGVEEAELVSPRRAFEREGAATVLIAPRGGKIQGFHHTKPASRHHVDLVVQEADVDTFDALFLPGGVASPDALRTSPDSVAFVRDFFEEQKPVCAICHAPWLLVEANVVRGRTVTSWPSLRTDLKNAGATWIDQAVVVERNLVTSRRPSDIPSFIEESVEAVERGPFVPPPLHHALAPRPFDDEPRDEWDQTTPLATRAPLPDEDASSTHVGMP